MCLLKIYLLIILEEKKETRMAAPMAAQEHNQLSNGQANKQMWQFNQEIKSFYNQLLMLHTQ